MTEHSLWRFSRALHRAINERQPADLEAVHLGQHRVEVQLVREPRREPAVAHQVEGIAIVQPYPRGAAFARVDVVHREARAYRYARAALRIAEGLVAAAHDEAPR